MFAWQETVELGENVRRLPVAQLKKPVAAWNSLEPHEKPLQVERCMVEVLLDYIRYSWRSFTVQSFCCLSKFVLLLLSAMVN